MNSTYLLLDDIRKRLACEFKGVVFRVPVAVGPNKKQPAGEQHQEPRIFIGQMPPKHSQPMPGGEVQIEDVPFILVKCLTGEVPGESPREYQVDVGIVFAVYSPEIDPEAGLQDLLNMADRIIALLSFNRYWANRHFVQSLPIRFVHGTGKADNVYASGMNAGPYYMGAVMTQFTAAALPQNPPRNIIDATEPEHPAQSSEDMHYGEE